MQHSAFLTLTAVSTVHAIPSRRMFRTLLVLVLLAFFFLPRISHATEHALFGKATWYGITAHGKPTANGEIYNRNRLTAAHLTLPFGTVVRVYNLKNGRQTLVRITDRGPFGKGRVVDLSYRSAQLVNMTKAGVVPVAMEVVAGTNGRPLAQGNSFFLHLASETQVQEAHKTSYDLQRITGLPIRALFSAQEKHLGFVLCSGPYNTFTEAETAFLKVEKVRPALGIIEAPTNGGGVPRHVPPAAPKRRAETSR